MSSPDILTLRKLVLNWRPHGSNTPHYTSAHGTAHSRNTSYYILNIEVSRDHLDTPDGYGAEGPLASQGTKRSLAPSTAYISACIECPLFPFAITILSQIILILYIHLLPLDKPQNQNYQSKDTLTRDQIICYKHKTKKNV